MSYTRTEAHGESWVEVVSDGTTSGTRVYLAIRSAGGELRYEIPNVSGVRWQISRQGGAHLELDIHSAQARTVVKVDRGKSTVEDLLAELAAARLVGDKEPQRFESQRFEISQQFGHASWCACVASRVCNPDDCDCGADDGSFTPPGT